jgi:hypothetical protein
MRVRAQSLGIGTALALVATLLFTTFVSAASGAQHVRWDIVSLVGGNAPGPVNPGGYADAKAPDNTYIRLTGSGTFVAPPGGNGGSGAVTGGGTWQTFSGPPSPGTSTGTGTYRVTELTSWVFANFQTAGVLTDNIVGEGRAANGTAVLKITFNDGSQGVLTVGCHGPGAPPGIFEGIATTKSYKTYYDVQPPQAGVDANRTIFHVR